MKLTFKKLFAVLLLALSIPVLAADYYGASGDPATGSALSSSVLRSEYSAIATGFTKVAPYTGNANKAVIINSGGTAQTVTTGTLALAGNFATTGAFNTTLIQGASVSLTLPTTTSTLAILGAQSFTGLQTFNAGISIPTGFNVTGAGTAQVTGFATISGTTLTGTLSTAAQPNVTSLGTLTGLTVTNAPTFSAMTATRVPYFGTAGLLSDSSALTFTVGSGTLAATVFSGAGTGLTGTAASLTAGNVTTNANLTGHVTSVGNAAVLGSFTLAQLNTAVSDADVAQLGANTFTGAQTLTSASPQLTLGVLNTTSGGIKFFGSTSGNVTLAPNVAAGASVTVTLPATSVTLNAAGDLTGNTLNSGVVTTSITTVGALNAGSITNGFGSIDVGADAISGGAITGTGQATFATSSGHVGIGVTPSGWGAFTKMLEMQGGSIGGTSTTDLRIFFNSYYDGGSYIYKATGLAARLEFTGGALNFLTAPSGTAGNAATFTSYLSIGNTGIHTMSAYGAGTATFSAAGVISSVSDERYKIKDGVIVNPIAMLNALEPGYFYGRPEANMGDARQLGFYAQNVRKAIGPEAAPDPVDGRPWGYFDRSVLAVVVEAAKNQESRLRTLEARLK